MKLAEYEFEIERKPGKKHVNADSLSRHIASMRPDETTLTEMKDMTEVRLTREAVFEVTHTGLKSYFCSFIYCILVICSKKMCSFFLVVCDAGGISVTVNTL